MDIFWIKFNITIKILPSLKDIIDENLSTEEIKTILNTK